VIDPIRLSFEVACGPEDAWMTWTERIGRWWPVDHTVSAEPDLEITLEGGVGGRIYERTAAGDEHDWGEVTVWEPPTRLAYLWHLRRDRADATEVEVTFTGVGAESTRVEIEHRGWERLGAQGVSWRDRNFGGWSTLLPHYIAAVGGGTTATTTDMSAGGSKR
jgi:uncharacterized protein YndB with AHSA1/START domain